MYYMLDCFWQFFPFSIVCPPVQRDKWKSDPLGRNNNTSFAVFGVIVDYTVGSPSRWVKRWLWPSRLPFILSCVFLTHLFSLNDIQRNCDPFVPFFAFFSFALSSLSSNATCYYTAHPRRLLSPFVRQEGLLPSCLLHVRRRYHMSTYR